MEEGKPLIKGFIEEKTLKWIEPNPIPDIHNMNLSVPIGIFGFMKVNFDLLIGKAGTVVTGVRFNFDNVTKSISLEIQTTPITWPVENASQIILKASESEWLSPAVHSAPREPLVFVNPGDEAYQKGPSMPDSVINSYVEFTTTSYETDLAQSVIPSFDTQPVFYYEGRRWLRGLGLMHKGKPGSGGFITPIIVPASPFVKVQYFPTPPV